MSCASSGNQNATCTLPTHCCFSNYTAQHDGTCMASACTWGTIDCDGPEDCTGGKHCCSHVLMDSQNGITGYTIACQASACGAGPANEELCHPTSAPAGTCSSAGAHCITATAANYYDLPGALHICQ